MVTFFDLIQKRKINIGAGANFGQGGPEKQLFFLPWPYAIATIVMHIVSVRLTNSRCEKQISL